MLFIWPTYTAAYFPGEADTTRKSLAIYFTLLIFLSAQATLSKFTRQLSEIKLGNELISPNMD